MLDLYYYIKKLILFNPLLLASFFLCLSMQVRKRLLADGVSLVCIYHLFSFSRLRPR